MTPDIASGLLGLLAVVLPLLINWLSGLSGNKVSPLVVEGARHDKALNDLATALNSGTTIDVASVWAKHDRLLSQAGLDPRPIRGSGRQQ
jgi:hypothetical protein